MTKWLPGRSAICLVLAAALCAAGTWLYAGRVMIPAQVAYARANGLPRGNSSDLYPRWLGSRELLLHGRDPYSMEITREIQVGFYGRPLPPDRPGLEQNYQQGFYYPVYVAFLLAPTLDLPFDKVRKGFFWVLLLLTAVTVPLWLRIVQWPLEPWRQAAVVVLMVGCLPVMQGLKLQQMTLLAAAMLAAAMVLLASDWPVPAGILLALATIKPQLVWLVLAWLAVWTLADWRRRYRWAASFAVTMAILCAASEWYLPHWIARFWQAIREYHSYTGEKSTMEMLIGPVSRVLELSAVAVVVVAGWRSRREGAGTGAFAFTVSLVLAVTVLVVPGYGPYNQALLLPALLLMAKERRIIWQASAVDRALCVITVCLIGWPWFTGIVLSALSFILPAQAVDKGSLIPVWTSLYIPVVVAASMLLAARRRTFGASRKVAAS